MRETLPESRPARARGLKRIGPEPDRLRLESRPARARGLKLEQRAHRAARRQSRPARARGLKLPLTTVNVASNIHALYRVHNQTVTLFFDPAPVM